MTHSYFCTVSPSSISTFNKQNKTFLNNTSIKLCPAKFLERRIEAEQLYLAY